MERKIGEVFEYEGKRLVAKETNIGSCTDCFFKLIGCTPQAKGNTGACSSMTRTDNKSVIFVQVTEGSEKQQAEQPQDEQPQELNLCEILKDCPQSEPFWSPLLGGVKFHDINQKRNFIVISLENGETWDINADGTITFGDVTSPEIMLYPSREQRDWTKVKYEPKKKLPKTWEEFCKNYLTGKAEYFVNSTCRLRETRSGAERQEVLDRNILPSKQAAEAHLALMQLHQLRDAWREGWLPDYNNDNQCKYAITKLRSEYEIFEYKVSSFFLSFQDERRADEFKDCFIDLIEKAGDLI